MISLKKISLSSKLTCTHQQQFHVFATLRQATCLMLVSSFCQAHATLHYMMRARQTHLVAWALTSRASTLTGFTPYLSRPQAPYLTPITFSCNSNNKQRHQLT